MKRAVWLSSVVVMQFWLLGPVLAQKPSAEQALELRPMQADVEYDRPEAARLKQCSIAAESQTGGSAWVVRGPSGEVLRRFVDSNGDNKVDQWCYYRGGLEVYRDVDADFNGKADQYRWLHTAGTRWGLDDDEDAKIDQWKIISPEEVTALVVAAVQKRDGQLFQSLLLRPSELSTLGLGKQRTEDLSARIDSARKGFAKFAAGQQAINASTQWFDFGALRPGTIPAGSDGSTRDVTVYENVIAMIETDGQPTQLPIGALIRVGDGWRLVDLPNVGDDQDASRFVFFQPVTQPAAVDGAVGGVSEQTQQLVESLEKIDDQLTRARGEAETKRLNDQRADVLEKLAAAAANETDRRMWLMQFADTVGAAAQSGTYPEGTTRLAALRKDLEADSQDAELLSHVVFAHMSSEYAAQLEAADADFGEVQENWLKQLQSFIERYPTSRDAPEAMLQLALAKEFAGEDEEANKWYTRIVDDFSDWPQVEKAAGAKRRLESVGRVLTLQGPTIDGKSFDLAKQRGSMVLIQYWATWCEPCKQDMEILANLQRQYARQGLKIVGVNLDQDRAGLARYFQANKPQWPHLYEPGGMESRLADELGVFTLPLMLLVDQSGKVVNRQVQASELETEIKKLLR